MSLYLPDSQYDQEFLENTGMEVTGEGLEGNRN